MAQKRRVCFDVCENKLDGDLANQKSLQKLSDPGGSRTLHKTDCFKSMHILLLFEWELLLTDSWGKISQTPKTNVWQENKARSEDSLC